jgi:hypothetical protein
MDPSDVDRLGLDRQAIARLEQDLARPTPRALRNVITMALLAAFWEALDRKRILTPPQMVRAMVKHLQKQREDPPTKFRRQRGADPRRLALQLEAIQHAYCTAARIYVAHFKDLIPETKTATKGRRRSIDVHREVLLRPDLTHLEKAKLLGLPCGTPDQRRQAKDIIRKRIELLEKRS